MKIIWESEDIKAGRRVAKPGCNEHWIIGYDPSIEDHKAHFALISDRDGMICLRGQTKKEMAEFLTNSGDLPIEVF